MISKYIEIAYNIKNLIESGVYPNDYKLSERKLAEQYNTSRATISSALQVLKDEGYIKSIPQSGSIVSRINKNTNIWSSFIDKSIGLNSYNGYKATIKYLSKNKKLNYTFGLNDYFEPYMPLKQALSSLIDDKYFNQYMNEYDIKGIYPLRVSIKNHLARYNINVPEDNIIVFNGYKEALFSITIALLSYNTNFYYMKDDMIKNMYLFQYAKLNMYEIDYDIHGIKVSSLTDTLKSGRNILYINPVHNYPTGITFSEQKIKNLTNLCKNFQIPVIENDFLRDIDYEGLTLPPPIKACIPNEVIYIGSLLNSNISGFKTAWVVAPDEVVDRICEIKSQIFTGNNNGCEAVINEMLAKEYYYEWLKTFKTKLKIHISNINKILNKYFQNIAEWNPDNISHTINLTFKNDVDFQKLLSISPYYLIINKLCNTNSLIIHTLTLSIEEFEELSILIKNNI